MPTLMRIFLILPLVLGLSACGGSQDDDGDRKSRIHTSETRNENGEGIVIIGKRKNQSQLSVARFFGGDSTLR